MHIPDRHCIQILKKGQPLKHFPLPVSFFFVMAITIALFIFFGAWAVSADAEERDRVFAFAAPGNLARFQETSRPGGRVGEATVQSNADTWWGGALLKACPLH